MGGRGEGVRARGTNTNRDGELKPLSLYFGLRSHRRDQIRRSLTGRQQTVPALVIRQGVKLPERKGNVLGNADELAAAGAQKGVPANPPHPPSASDLGSNPTGAAALACPPSLERVSSGCSSFPTSKLL